MWAKRAFQELRTAAIRCSLETGSSRHATQPMSKACVLMEASADRSMKTIGMGRRDDRMALPTSRPEISPRRPRLMTTQDALLSSRVLRNRSADVNMHTGYPCADRTRPKLRSTGTLSSTMSTTSTGIDMG